MTETNTSLQREDELRAVRDKLLELKSTHPSMSLCGLAHAAESMAAVQTASVTGENEITIMLKAAVKELTTVFTIPKAPTANNEPGAPAPPAAAPTVFAADQLKPQSAPPDQLQFTYVKKRGEPLSDE